MTNLEKGNLGYIPEIDTLRAIAVIFVLVFHAFSPILPGGFVGVDIFFTISGFVIARRYLFVLISGETTLVEFFLARFRRLMPALLLVTTLTTVGTLFILTPASLTEYGWSLAAQPFYSQNFVFWWVGDYFEAALTRPLLHTWSLAVEEQFYLVLALAVLLVRRFPRLIIWLIVAALVLSYLLGVMIEPRSPKTAFFLLPTRIWQFALGIAAAVLLSRIPRFGHAVAWAGLAGLGVAAMIAAAILFSEGATFPGSQALIACGGVACALVAVGQATGMASMAWLRLRPVLYVGQISYGLYLWHWPPLSLWYIHTGQVAQPLTAFCLILLATIVSMASYHLLEKPIRNGNWLPRPRQIVTMTLVTSLSVASVGMVFVETRGLLVRYEHELRAFFDAPNQRGTFRCGKLFAALNPSAEMCAIASGTGSQNSVLILGDSHADVLKEKIASIGLELGMDVYLTTRNCDLGRFHEGGFCSQATLNNVIVDAKELGIAEIFAISLWEKEMFSVESMTADIRRLTDAGFRIVIFQDVPQSPALNPVLRARAALEGSPLDMSGLSRAAHLSQSAGVRAMIAAAVSEFSEEQVRLVDLADPICAEEECYYHVGGVPIYFDSNHLTFTGADILAPLLRDVLTREAP